MDAFLLLVVVLRPEVGLREIAEECRNPLQRPRLGDGDDSATGISLLVATACTILLSADIAFRLLHAIFIALTCSLITLQYMTATASSDPASKGTPACPPREDSCRHMAEKKKILAALTHKSNQAQGVTDREEAQTVIPTAIRWGEAISPC
jgi:hypothetical protein